MPERFVLHTVPGLSEESSGPSYSVVRLCESLLAAGSQTVLAAVEFGPTRSLPYLRTFPLAPGPRRLGFSPSMRRWIGEQARDGRLRVIHNHGMWQANAIYPAWSAWRYGIPYVMSPRGALSRWAMQHGSKWKKVVWRPIQRPALNRAFCFHATAMSECADIRRLGFTQPVAVIPNGIDLPPLGSKAKDGVRRLMFLGRIHPVKGLDLLLRAWARVENRFPAWRLIVGGGDEGYYRRGGELAKQRSLARSLHLSRVDFLGELKGAAKTQAYAEAELFVLPTRSENFGVTVAEALAAGVPAIVTKGAPWAELDARGAGWWIDVGVEPLAACLETALSVSPARLDEMGVRGRTWMEAAFSWPEIGRKMVATYAWILGQGEKPEWVQQV